MDAQSRRGLSGLTFYLLVLIAAVLTVGAIDLVFCAGLGINPFRERTTGFLIAGFIALMGLAVLAFLLNVATNLSLIADRSVVERSTKPFPIRRVFAGVGVGSIVTLVIIGVGTWSSQQRFLSVVQEQTQEMLAQNQDIVDRIGSRLAAGQRSDFEQIAKAITFLKAQRRDLPNLTVIYGGKFSGKDALFQANDYVPSDRFEPRYYECRQNRDCEYLKAFLGGKDQPVLKHIDRSSDDFYLYYPVVTEGARFVLLLERHQRYGKLGS